MCDMKAAAVVEAVGRGGRVDGMMMSTGGLTRGLDDAAQGAADEVGRGRVDGGLKEVTGVTGVKRVVRARLEEARGRLMAMRGASEGVRAQEAVVAELERVWELVEVVVDGESRLDAENEDQNVQSVGSRREVDEMKKATRGRVNREGGATRALSEEVVRERVTAAVKMVVQLVYCASLFDPFVPYQVEKAAMLAWMHHTQESRFQMELPRFAEMLDAIGVLGKMITRRPLGEGKSHAESVQYCQDVALRYVLGGEETMLGWSGFMTKAQVEGALDQVMQSGYFTSEGVMYGGLGEMGGRGQGRGQQMGPHGSEMRPACGDGDSSTPSIDDRESLDGEYVKGGVEGGEKVSTPSPARDQVGMSSVANESGDSASEHEHVGEREVDVEFETSCVEGAFKGEDAMGMATEVKEAVAADTGLSGDGNAGGNPGGRGKKKASGGKKKKGNFGKSKSQTRAGSPEEAGRGAPPGAREGVIQTTHKVLPQREQKKKNPRN